MNITLVDFQLKAIAELMDAMRGDKKEIVLKSCTGSGKTIILTHFMDTYQKSFAKTIFIWLTPGKGDLEDQSKAKMDKYIHGAQTKLLSDIMTAGFESGDACFINWEKLTRRGNNALKEGERTNFFEHIERALSDGLSFKIIVDESHEGDTPKAQELIGYFKTDKIIRASATPKNYRDAVLVVVPEEEVIASGLIKKVLIINENFEQNIAVANQVDYLLTKALTKQRELLAAYAALRSDINPLIIVQLMNENDAILLEVEKWFFTKGISYENGLLSVRLAGRHENVEDVTESNARPIAIITKQAIATGWDCPRAQILVKMRENMSEVFEIQTIGRIRRMPEARHYDNDLLDSCYLYTLDEKFTESVKLSMGKGALDAAILKLKEEYLKIKLTSEQVSGVVWTRDKRQVVSAIYAFFKKRFGIDSKTLENKKRLEAHGFIFASDIITFTKSGEVAALGKRNIEDLNDISIRTKLDTHHHGREYHHKVGDIALRVSMEYADMNAILRRLFERSSNSDFKILSLELRDLYAFVINNFYLLRDCVVNASAVIQVPGFGDKFMPLSERTTTQPFFLPRECLFTYDGFAKSQAIRTKNVYAGYLSSAEPRFSSERTFERYCESATSVDWIYKNGDKGSEFFSIVYEDAYGDARRFFPDYVLSVNGEIWIIETKGGFNKYGGSEDIDKFSGRKFEFLKAYLMRYGLKGGFVREDKKSGELCICTEEYRDDINSEAWKLLGDIIV